MNSVHTKRNNNNIVLPILVFWMLFFFVLSLQIESILKISFIFNLIPIIGGTYYYLYYQSFSIANGAVIVFTFLFYFLAPLLQLDANSVELINTVKYDTNLLLMTNTFVFIFLSVYHVSMYSLSTKKRNNIQKQTFNSPQNNLFYILLILSVLVAIKGFREVSTIVSTLQIDFESDSNERIMAMFERKVLYMIPYITLSTLFLTIKLSIYTLILLLLLLLLVFITKNPLLDRRNALGPIYISLLIFSFRSFFTINYRVFVLFFIMMVVLFPLTSLLTHIEVGDWGENTINYKELLVEHFVDLHYDAWANIPAGIIYVEKKGYSFGGQLLGSIMFWVPRSIWEYKPISTGELIGNFLMQFENLHFNNISATVVLEGYIDFGLIGIITYGFLLALFVNYLNKIYESEDIFRKIFSVYASVFLFFILRGALLPAVAYLSGAWLAIIFLPNLLKFLAKSISLINFFNFKWK